MSRIIESLRSDLAALEAAGGIGRVTMREFEEICPPPVWEFSQPVAALQTADQPLDAADSMSVSEKSLPL